MKKLLVFLSAMLLLTVSSNAFALSVLVNDNSYSWNGYGSSSWGNMNAALDTATNNNVDVVSDYSNLSQMLSYDALWLDVQSSSAVLTGTEVSNIASFISTGRKVVMIGENSYWNGWNNQILSIVGGTYSGAFSGNVTSIVSNEITNGADTLYLPTGGIVVSGGTALYNKNFATLWGENVLTVLDANIFQDYYWSRENNGQFDTNIANWVADSNIDPVPEPATMLLLGTGLIGLAGLRRKKFKK